MSRHVLVVGAGPGGLTAAALLAKAGVRVTVLERLPHIGGRTSNFTRNGFRFDHGPTFFHYPQVLEKILRGIGYDLWAEPNLIRLDPNYRLVFGSGGELLATSNFRNMEAAVAKVTPRGAIPLFAIPTMTALHCPGLSGARASRRIFAMQRKSHRAACIAARRRLFQVS